MKVYSFKKGLAKALVSTLTILGAWVVVAGVSEISLWDLVETYVKPFIGTLTIGGLLALILNWLKIRYYS